MMKAYSYHRISSMAQTEGDGIRRQIEASRAYASANGMTLDEELSDIGLSAFHGKHVSGGTLGAFLSLVTAGKIDKGSVLIVESLDRLSREDPFTAQLQFMNILAAEIDVVTIVDRQRYSRSGNTSQMFSALGIVNRAHDESKTKSERAKAKIAQRRTDAMNGKKTYVLNGPSWINQVRVGSGEYRHELNERAATIREIFELYDANIGAHSIARKFNLEKRPVIASRGRYELWRDASIMFILKSEAAIGTYAVGDDFRVKDYYPRVISDDLWFRVQDKLQSHHAKKGGRRGERFTNLFQGFISCHNCGTPVRTVRGGNINKQIYFGCQQNFIGGHGCSVQGRKMIRLEKIEAAILKHVQEYHTDNANGPSQQRNSVVNDLANAKSQISDLAKRITNLRSVIETAESDEDRISFVARLNELRKETERHNHTVSSMEKRLREIDENTAQANDINAAIVGEISSWPTMEKTELFSSRARINQSLRKIISTIRIDFPAQEAYVFVGGMTKGWRLNAKGEVTGQMDWSHIPWSVLQTYSKNELGLDATKLRDAKSVNANIGGERLDEALFAHKPKPFN